MIRVLVVDDSGFFRRRIVEILDADDRLQVIGTAANGREAIQKVMELKPDVVTMDIEMPVMDGITAVRRIMKLQPTPILMFSSLSYDGAQATLDALEAGALDFLPKRFDEFSQDREEAKRMLRARVRQIGARGLAPKPAAVAPGPAAGAARTG
ncbi:MAG TPA: response regulator, partial [Gammaproteobacteria bacterium]